MKKNNKIFVARTTKLQKFLALSDLVFSQFNKAKHFAEYGEIEKVELNCDLMSRNLKEMSKISLKLQAK